MDFTDLTWLSTIPEKGHESIHFFFQRIVERVKQGDNLPLACRKDLATFTCSESFVCKLIQFYQAYHIGVMRDIVDEYLLQERANRLSKS